MKKKLKENWKFPELPKGYDSAFVTIGMSGNVEIDYTSKPIIFLGFVVRKSKVHSIHSKNKAKKVIWPWVKGYSPNESDWSNLGFLVGKSFDNCFGSIPDDLMFKDWLDKDV